jgi:hypothetical protein
MPLTNVSGFVPVLRPIRPPSAFSSFGLNGIISAVSGFDTFICPSSMPFLIKSKDSFFPGSGVRAPLRKSKNSSVGGWFLNFSNCEKST